MQVTTLCTDFVSTTKQVVLFRTPLFRCLRFSNQISNWFLHTACTKHSFHSYVYPHSSAVVFSCSCLVQFSRQKYTKAWALVVFIHQQQTWMSWTLAALIWICATVFWQLGTTHQAHNIDGKLLSLCFSHCNTEDQWMLNATKIVCC